MGRGAGYIALYCGIANGAEDILLPEKYDYDEQKLINNIIENRKRGKNIISSSMQKVSDILQAWLAVSKQLPAWRQELPSLAICSVEEARHVQTVYMHP